MHGCLEPLARCSKAREGWRCQRPVPPLPRAAASRCGGPKAGRAARIASPTLRWCSRAHYMPLAWRQPPAWLAAAPQRHSQQCGLCCV